ncbi:Alpha/Beta hydrolase protein [Cryomyces antarcticus]
MLAIIAFVFCISTLASSSALPATSPSPPKSSPLPLVIWHGLGDNYAADGLTMVGKLAQKINPGTYVHIIRLDEDVSADRGATFFGNLTEQIAQVCEDLAAHPVLSKARAINALGFSQGGQFLRAYVERCNSPPVRNLVTFGSQHNGISRFQDCAATDWLCKAAIGLLRTNTWSSFIQNKLVPAQYYREVNETTGLGSDQYLKYSNFLADINNERAAKNKTYAANIAKLRKLVMYVFEDDTTVIPKESGWFAEVNATTQAMTPLRNRTVYDEDWIGLKKLDEKDGLVFRTAPGAHMELSDEMLKAAFEEYFGPDPEADEMGDWVLVDQERGRAHIDGLVPQDL